MTFADKLRNVVYGKVRVGNVTMADGQESPVLLDANGRQRVALDSVPSHPVTGSGTFTTAPASPTTHQLQSAATTNAAVVVNSAATLSNVAIFNGSASKVFVKYYNKSTTPAPATDVPVLTIPVEPGQFLAVNFGTQGQRFATGIGIAVTGAAADNDATAVTTGVKVSTSRI